MRGRLDAHVGLLVRFGTMKRNKGKEGDRLCCVSCKLCKWRSITKTGESAPKKMDGKMSSQKRTHLCALGYSKHTQKGTQMMDEKRRHKNVSFASDENVSIHLLDKEIPATRAGTQSRVHCRPHTGMCRRGGYIGRRV